VADSHVRILRRWEARVNLVVLKGPGLGEEKVQDQKEIQRVVVRMGEEKVLHLLYLYPYQPEDRSDNPDDLEQFPGDQNPRGVPQWSRFASVGRMSDVEQEWENECYQHLNAVHIHRNP
jgi:hypothetical protein